MNQLDKHIGRIVRLNPLAFRELSRRAARQGAQLDNCFLVADVSRELRKLICYGGNLRITVGIPDVALI